MNPHSLSLSVAEALLQAEVSKDSSRRGAAGLFERERSRLHPCVTISREAGALGNTVANEVGRRLGCPVYDREIVERTAAELHQPPSRLQVVDERPSNWLEDAVAGLSLEARVPSDVYARYLVGTVHGMAAMGTCVLVGRGAGFVLPAASAFNVRLVAPLAFRVRTIRQRRYLAELEAADWVVRADRDRTEFVRTNFGADPADPCHYDLVINTSRMPVDGCAELIVQAFRRFEARQEAQAGLST